MKMATTTTTTPTTTAQLIDANGEFIGQLPVTESDAHIHSYRTVAVVGCQSGGKSTLLNHVFGTQFPVLDAPKSGRRRTTLGIWASVASTKSNVPASSSNSRYIVLDVEGTDSRERGEGAKTFENRTTLFTLALSDVVLVNMWAHDLGRYSAANYDLFDTVFAHAIALRRQKLFTKPVKVIIVVRDHDGESSLADIKRVLMGDLMNIWQNLNVPDISLEDVFEIDVITLPHKNYATAAFEQGVKQFAERLNRKLFSSSRNDKDDNTLLAPLGGFDALAKQVWNSVSGCTGGADGIGLDLPKQAALAAYYRCGEIVQSLITYAGEIGQELQTLRVDVETNWQSPLRDFSKRTRETTEGGLVKYDEKTAGYAKAGFGGTNVKEEVLKAVSERRREFGAELVKGIEEVRERFLSVCWDYCINGFEDEFRPMLGGTRGFERNAKRLARSYIRKYKGFVDDAQLPRCLRQYVDIARRNEAEESSPADVSVDREEEGRNGEGEEVDILDLDLQVVEMDLTVDLDEETNENSNENGSDGEDDDGDEYCIERFKKEMMRKIEERKRMAELMLPGGAGGLGPVGPKPEPWWKGMLIRGLILLINYLQASQGQRAAIKMQREQEKEFPPNPTF